MASSRRPRRPIAQISGEITGDGRLSQSQKVSRRKRTDGSIKKARELGAYPKTDVLLVIRWGSPERTVVFDSLSDGHWGNIEDIVSPPLQ
jgi:hypothetical protein